MRVKPEIQVLKKIAAEGDYDIAPICTEILSDFTTPIEVMKIFKNISTHCFLLESAQADHKWGRYTFIGYDPKMAISCADGEITAGEITVKTDDPSAFLRDILSKYRSPKAEVMEQFVEDYYSSASADSDDRDYQMHLPSFTGGLVGYFSFDYLGYSEPTVRNQCEDSENFKDVDLMLFDKVIVFDHFRQKIMLVANIRLADVETNYKAAIRDLEHMVELITHGEKCKETSGKLLGEVTPLFDKKAFVDMVNKAKENIREGDIFQIVLSNRLSAPFEGSLLDTYRQLRTINPSPYMFYFSGTDVEVAGASPETLVKLEDGVLHTFPLAGSRPRGRTEEEDLALEKELLADEKELAEHNMLVDLGRNDLGRISKFGTVEVETLREVLRYSHIMHIGSIVRGVIRDDKDSLDAIEAVLPAGTLSGAPKIRACQLISKYENNKRGIYGGAIGYIDFTGNMDTCIAIRIAYKKNGKVFVRSGAGIVADSDPEKEFEESMNKAKASLTALMAASGEGEL